MPGDAGDRGVTWEVFPQDVDEAYMSKVELESRLESLTDEINFLRQLYEEVWGCLGFGGPGFGRSLPAKATPPCTGAAGAAGAGVGHGRGGVHGQQPPAGHGRGAGGRAGAVRGHRWPEPC